MKVFKETKYGRPIIDSYVANKQLTQKEMFDNAVKLPKYFGDVNIDCQKVTLTTVPRSKRLEPQTLIEPFIQTIPTLELDKVPSSMIYVDNGTPNTIPMHVELIRFVKAAIATSYSTSLDMSECYSAMVHHILQGKGNVTVPIPFNPTNKVQEIVIEQLNEYLVQFCEDKGIKYSEQIIHKKSGKNPLLVAAESAYVR